MPKKRFVLRKSGGDKTSRRIAKQQTLLRRAVEDWPQFDGNEAVNGGDLVEWFAAFRANAKRLMNQT